MKLELDFNTRGKHRVNSYSDGSIEISDRIYSTGIILSPHTIIEDSLPDDMEKLTTDNLDIIMSLDPEVVIMGTGVNLRFPGQEILIYFNTRKIGLEVMDTGAACRAYNILMSEDRRVVAVLFMFEPRTG